MYLNVSSLDMFTKVKQVEFLRSHPGSVLLQALCFKGGAQQTADEKKPATKSRFFHIPRQNHAT